MKCLSSVEIFKEALATKEDVEEMKNEPVETEPAVTPELPKTSPVPVTRCVNLNPS